MKKLVKDLKLYEIDYLVAKAEGLDAKIVINRCVINGNNNFYVYSPTDNPAQAWPIIERERINLFYYEETEKWCATKKSKCSCFGVSTLIAAMRCYVASKFGDEVEI